MFANAGSYDVLITDVRCFFSGKDKGSGTYPRQELKIHSAGNLLLEKGKLLHCSAEFQEPLSKGVVDLGQTNPEMIISGEPLLMVDLTVEVDWVRSDGKSLRSQQTLFQYGLSSLGVIHTRSPLPSHAETRFLLKTSQSR